MATPVLGYKLGVLPEIVDESAGYLVQADGDPFKGEAPGNVEGLVEAALALLDRRYEYSQGARTLAEKRFDLERMVDEYYKVLFVD
ncbi:MAG: hypothetical protein KatS3mg081_0021 [Gemmatimonadales bacterium]|nr:MAG: hypothetical protein KatS3mg081_0021 [Gemmatimonadales bacterium]